MTPTQAADAAKAKATISTEFAVWMAEVDRHTVEDGDHARNHPEFLRPLHEAGYSHRHAADALMAHRGYTWADDDGAKAERRFGC